MLHRNTQVIKSVMVVMVGMAILLEQVIEQGAMTVKLRYCHSKTLS